MKLNKFNQLKSNLNSSFNKQINQKSTIKMKTLDSSTEIYN